MISIIGKGLAVRKGQREISARRSARVLQNKRHDFTPLRERRCRCVSRLGHKPSLPYDTLKSAKERVNSFAGIAIVASRALYVTRVLRLALIALTCILLFADAAAAHSWREKWATVLTTRHGFAIAYPAASERRTYDRAVEATAWAYTLGAGQTGYCDE
jgi:hypothetical protein